MVVVTVAIRIKYNESIFTITRTDTILGKLKIDRLLCDFSAAPYVSFLDWKESADLGW